MTPSRHLAISPSRHLTNDCDLVSPSRTLKVVVDEDEAKEYAELCRFIDTISRTGSVQHFVIHARKAILGGLSPEQNRKIPQLKYRYVYVSGCRWNRNSKLTFLVVTQYRVFKSRKE